MEDWELKNILDRSLYEAEERAKNNRIGEQINARKSGSDSIIPGWVWIVLLIVAGGIANLFIFGQIIFAALGALFGF